MIYSPESVAAKSGDLIPVFKSGKPFHSKYSPANDNILFDASPDESAFVVIGGIGAGFHLANILKNYPSFHIVAVEADTESLEFSMGFEKVRELSECKRITFVSAENIQKAVSENYIPAIHGNFMLKFHRAWENENRDLCPLIADCVKKSLDSLSSDFSVQAHFGKLWQRNIMLNLRMFPEAAEGLPEIPQDKITKTAAVIAAGPSLDHSVELLLKHREKYFVISTDTAFEALCTRGIECDAIVSVDCQHVSSEHFFEKPLGSPFFVFDISSSPDCVKKVRENGSKFCFIRSRHPLSMALASGIPILETGAGTVTIACCDLARRLGLSKIELFGADFCCSWGKAYTRGTYLEKKFYSNQNRTDTAETKYDALMFRTELEEKKGGGTFGPVGEDAKISKVLMSYETSLMKWITDNSLSVSDKRIILPGKKVDAQIESNISSECFLKKAGAKIESLSDSEAELEDGSGKEVLFPFLPYIAWLKKNGRSASLAEDLKLAYKAALRYNGIL